VSSGEPELRISTERQGTLVNLVPQIDSGTFDAVLAPVHDGVQVMRMVTGTYASAAQGAELTLPPLPG